MATTGRRPFFLSAAADRAGSSTRTTDVDSLVRDKGRQASQKILRYLRRSCSSRAMRLDLVMLIIARKIRETEVCAGGWAESGQRARAWEEKGKTLGNPPQRGSAARWGQPGGPRTARPERHESGLARPARLGCEGSRNMGVDWLAAGLPTAASQEANQPRKIEFPRA